MATDQYNFTLVLRQQLVKVLVCRSEVYAAIDFLETLALRWRIEHEDVVPWLATVPNNPEVDFQKDNMASVKEVGMNVPATRDA